ncbi:MAG: YHYH protein [Actinobacteria bacterium]|nr:YHYH protein [Actinomycetota bacterium]
MKRSAVVGLAVGMCATAGFGSAASASVAPEGSGATATAQVRPLGDISGKPWVPTTLRSATVNGIRVGPQMMDGKIVSLGLQSPARNSIYVCQQFVPIPGGGVIPAPDKFTLANTPWVSKGNTITISKIQTVAGAVQLAHSFKVTTTKTTRHFKGNGIPNHPIGVFPIPSTAAAYPYYAALPSSAPYANAAEIPVLPYDLDVTVQRNPKVNATPTCINDLTTGIVTQTGGAWHVEVAPNAQLQIFDPNAALPTDRCFGHPFSGMYHYHGYSWKCFPNKGAAGRPSPLYGYALDGFGVYGPFGENGKLIHNTELDVCHGHYGWIKWDGVWKRMYHYHVNNEYPYSIGCFRGTPAMPSAGMAH